MPSVSSWAIAALCASSAAAQRAVPEACTGACLAGPSSPAAKTMKERVTASRVAAEALYGARRSNATADLPTGFEPCVDGMAGGVFPCDNLDLLSRVSLMELGSKNPDKPYDGSDIWGWADPETGDEFAISLTIESAVIVNVTDPVAPVPMFRIASRPGFEATDYWRDVKVYKNTAYIVADEIPDHGMQIFDLERTRTYQAGSGLLEAEPDFVYMGQEESHNIFINEKTGFGYLMGGNRCTGGLHIVDLKQDRLKPEFVGCLADAIPYNSVETPGMKRIGYAHDAQCVEYQGPDANYTGREICVVYGEDQVIVWDVTNKTVAVTMELSAAELLSESIYPGRAYTHQGWFTEDQRFVLVGDESDEVGTASAARTAIFDMASLTAPKLVGISIGETTSIDHNLYVKGDLAYLSNYQSGLRIAKLDSLYAGAGAQLKEVAFFETQTNDYPEAAFWGAWSSYVYFPSGNIITMDIVNGLFVLRYTGNSTASPSAAPSQAPSTQAPTSAPTEEPSSTAAGATAGVIVAAAVVAALAVAKHFCCDRSRAASDIEAGKAALHDEGTA